MTLEDHDLDRLYGLPLDEFAAERAALGQRLEDEGLLDDASAVMALPKPTVLAWAINQLTRQRRELISDLLAALDRVHAAQNGSHEDLEHAPSLSEALKDEKAATTRIEELAPAILSDAGYVASRSTVDRALRSLRAAAADEVGRVQLELGRLAHDFDVSDGTDQTLRETAGARPEARRARDTIDLELETQRRQAVLKREEQEERRRQEHGRREQEEARRAAQKKLDTARRTLESAREAETRLEREFNGAQRERQEADRRLREAERLADQAEKRFTEAREAREVAEQELDDLKKSH